MSFGNISQKFTSQKELDAYCEKRGVTVEAPNSDARKYIADMSRENAEQAARDNGFRDLDHYHNATLDERRDRVAATREAESKKRVSIFGSDAKVAADDKKAWKDALPT